MPTHQDETLPQRYAREHQDYLNLCGSMTAEQVADLQLQLHNSLAREQALQQRLTAADDRADVLEGLLRDALNQRELSITISRRIEAALRPAEAAKCGVCGQGAWACNEGGCHYLESGNGEPEEGGSDET